MLLYGDHTVRPSVIVFSRELSLLYLIPKSWGKIVVGIWLPRNKVLVQININRLLSRKIFSILLCEFSEQKNELILKVDALAIIFIMFFVIFLFEVLEMLNKRICKSFNLFIAPFMHTCGLFWSFFLFWRFDTLMV